MTRPSVEDFNENGEDDLHEHFESVCKGVTGFDVAFVMSDEMKMLWLEWFGEEIEECSLLDCFFYGAIAAAVNRAVEEVAENIGTSRDALELALELKIQPLEKRIVKAEKWLKDSRELSEEEFDKVYPRGIPDE